MNVWVERKTLWKAKNVVVCGGNAFYLSSFRPLLSLFLRLDILCIFLTLDQIFISSPADLCFNFLRYGSAELSGVIPVEDSGWSLAQNDKFLKQKKKTIANQVSTRMNS